MEPICDYELFGQCCYDLDFPVPCKWPLCKHPSDEYELGKEEENEILQKHYDKS